MLSSKWLAEHQGCSANVRALCEEHFTMIEVWEHAGIVERVEFVTSDKTTSMDALCKIAVMLMKAVVPQLNHRLKRVYGDIARHMDAYFGPLVLHDVEAFNDFCGKVNVNGSADQVLAQYAYDLADACGRAKVCKDESAMATVLKLYVLKLNQLGGEMVGCSWLTRMRVRMRAHAIKKAFAEAFGNEITMLGAFMWH